jgi:hypothetical protein
MEANEQPFIPTNFEGLPELSDIVVCPSETGSNSYDCLLEAILLPIQYRDIFVGLRSPWKGGNHTMNHFAVPIHLLNSAVVWATRNREAIQPTTFIPSQIHTAITWCDFICRKNKIGTSRL